MTELTDDMRRLIALARQWRVQNGEKSAEDERAARGRFIDALGNAATEDLADALIWFSDTLGLEVAAARRRQW